MVPTSATSINVSWGSPSDHDCYTIDSYIITCQNPATSREVTSVINVPPTVVTNLTPNTSYECSVAAIVHNKKGNLVRFDTPPARNISHTLPLPPNRPSRPESTNYSHDSITLELPTIRRDSSVSIAQIIVVRLANGEIPQGSPELLYPTSDNFATYEEVRRSPSGGVYIAAELNANELPSTFVIGHDEVNKKRSNHIINGPLLPSSYYTCFLRLYSSWIGGQTYSVHNSSVFMFPVVQTKSDEPSSSPFNTAAVIVPLFMLLLILVIIVIVLAVTFFVRLAWFLTF